MSKTIEQLEQDYQDDEAAAAAYVAAYDAVAAAWKVWQDSLEKEKSDG
tara:strand:+ start:57 stop:200 length:144 start_codon:yes stop_codon:yes gene_type:complete